MKIIEILLTLSCIAIFTLSVSLWFANDKLMTAEEAKMSALVELYQLKSKCKGDK